MSPDLPLTRLHTDELFSECHKEESFDGLCVDSPELVWNLVATLMIALVMKALLTVVTFGIKLPGEFIVYCQSGIADSISPTAGIFIREY